MFYYIIMVYDYLILMKINVQMFATQINSYKYITIACIFVIFYNDNID